VRNPLPAEGGVEPEPIAEVKRLAPYAFRARLERAVTAADYAAIAERDEPDVQRAAAQLRWTGSWYEATVAVDPRGGDERRPPLFDALRAKLERHRRVGHDLVVLGADYVPLRIKLTICVRPHHLRGHVEAAVREVLGTGVLPSGRTGFFHPDSLSFGEGVALSPLVAAVQAVEGVESVVVDTFTRYFEPSPVAKEAGILALAPNEIAQLRNDPNFPELGTLELVMRGGR
jgi:predicted phage baseplate assembly protein